MQEQQGNLEEPLSDLPGPRWDDPFKKGKRMKNNNNNKVDEIVAKTAEALGTGKAFGGWTDKVEQTVKQGPPIKIKLGKGRKIGSRVADIGPGGKEYNVKTDAEWDKQNKDKSGTMKGLMTPKQKGTKVGVLSHVEQPSNGGILNERHAPLPKSSEFSVNYPMGDNKQVTKLTKLGGSVDRANKRVRFDFDSAAARTQFRNKNKKILGKIKESLDEIVATPPRQLKDKKKEMLVHDKKGKVTTIDRKDYEQYKKKNPGGGVAESVGNAIGRMKNEGLLGGVLGMMAGGPIGAYFGHKIQQAAGAKKKKTWDDKQ